MNRRIDESYISYVDRASQSLADGLIGYQEWSEAVLAGLYIRKRICVDAIAFLVSLWISWTRKRLSP